MAVFALWPGSSPRPLAPFFVFSQRNPPPPQPPPPP
ncbi:OmpA family protein, partial [Pseudoalteromonas sp. S4492]